jgi:radical SAM superfamily enzyme YgiQ (UPF0313 family)
MLKAIMIIELISPGIRDPRNIGKSFHLPQISLALLASITPHDIDISITDEIVSPINYDNKIDLVGITVNTETAIRAYQIADEFRSRGIPVVLGGIHPRVAPHEAIKHADSLVLGEAEDLWPQLLKDFKNTDLKKIYRIKKYPNLKKYPLPKRDLLDRSKYDTINLVQTSRGCPYSCHFCTVSAQYGKGIRFRPIDNVIAEIESLENNEIFFVDDNLIGRKDYAKQFLNRLIPLNKNWIGQTSIAVSDDEDFLKLLYESGCRGLFIGFETTSITSLNEVGKTQNIRHDYLTEIKKFHDNGISILGSFIVGFDSDDSSCFERLLEFVHKSKIDVIDISTLTPFPGTLLYKRELFEGRILVLREFYKLFPTLKRCIEGIKKPSIFGKYINWKGNMGYRKYINNFSN